MNRTRLPSADLAAAETVKHQPEQPASGDKHTFHCRPADLIEVGVIIAIILLFAQLLLWLGRPHDPVLAELAGASLMTTVASVSLVLAVCLGWPWFFRRNAEPVRLPLFSLLLIILIENCLAAGVDSGSDPVMGLGAEAWHRYVEEQYALFGKIPLFCAGFGLVCGLRALHLTRIGRPDDAAGLLIAPWILARFLTWCVAPWLDPDRLPLWPFIVLPLAGTACGLLAGLALAKMARRVPQEPLR